MANLKYIGKNILNHDLILKKGDVSGSNASTGSFGNISISNNASVTGDMVVGGKLTAQEIHTEIESASIIFTSGSTKFGDTSDDTHEFTGSILVKGDLTAENLTTDSSSVSTRLTTEESNVDALQTDSGSFSTRVTDLKTDSGSFSTRITNLKSDSGSFSTRTTDLEVASASFSTRITTAETELELTLISSSAQIATQISGAFDTVSSSLSSRLQIAETELENTLISGSAQLASQISGAFTSGFEFDGTISGSSTSTGSFGLVLQNGNELSTFLGAAGTETLFSGSLVSTGSFGRLEATDMDIRGTGSFDKLAIGPRSATLHNYSGMKAQLTIEAAQDSALDRAIYIKQTPDDFGYVINTNGSVTGDFSLHNVAGGTEKTNPAISTGQDQKVGIGTFTRPEKLSVGGNIHSTGIVTASSFTGIFNGALSSSAQIASNISGAFAVASASFAADILSNSSSFATRITADSSSFSTRVTDLKTDSGSFSTRVTKNEGTGSKILNGELEFTNITGSGHISMSLSSTGSFGRVSATTIGGHSPIVIDGETTFINSITSSAHVSSSMTSTASFGRVNAVALGGHQSLTIDPITTFTNVITASSAVQLDGKVFIQTGSIEGDLHVRTNENLMRIGKSTSGLIVSGSEQVSRFATGSDGSIIDLGFTVTDEDGNVVLAGDGDGIHIDGNNYWYNNKYYKIGDGRENFLNYDDQTLKYSGEVTAQTGSFNGEMFINSPTGSMFIGKFTGGIPSSGSDNVSRFATGSDGSIIDLGFTTTDESGETVFLTTGDGVVVDSNNYWYTTGHFKIGDANNFINWNTSNLTVSGTFTGDGSGLSGLPQSFTNITSSGDALFQSNVKINGRLTAQELHTEIESASIIFTSGSTIFGNSIDDTHTFTGSLRINGDMGDNISGSAVSTGSFGIIENNTQIAGFRPIINQTADFSASLSNAGRYHIVHGNLTCSIGTDANMPVTIGAEYEFFQSSSVGKFLFQTGSGVSLLSKNDNKNIAGQHSGATLKKVAANTFHLVGDLT